MVFVELAAKDLEHGYKRGHGGWIFSDLLVAASVLNACHVRFQCEKLGEGESGV